MISAGPLRRCAPVAPVAVCRASDVLRSSADGVSREGSDDVKVTLRIADASRLTIRAKQGYWSTR